MDKKNTPILYIKPGCPWCRQARAFFSDHGVDLDIRDVTLSAQNMQRMIEGSGQSLTPTFEYDGIVIADFSVDEFLDEIEQMPEVKRDLGLGAKEDWQ